MKGVMEMDARGVSDFFATTGMASDSEIRSACLEIAARKRAAKLTASEQARESANHDDSSCGRCGGTPSRCTCLKPAENE